MPDVGERERLQAYKGMGGKKTRQGILSRVFGAVKTGQLPTLALTGHTEEELAEMVKANKGMFKEQDKGMHEMGSYLGTKRWGSTLTTAAGHAKEVFTGGLQAIQGGGFFGPSGYDPADIAANYKGISKAEKEKKSRFTRGAGSTMFIRG